MPFASRSPENSIWTFRAGNFPRFSVAEVGPPPSLSGSPAALDSAPRSVFVAVPARTPPAVSGRVGGYSRNSQSLRACGEFVRALALDRRPLCHLESLDVE